jgi:hypothetical protein
MPDKLGEFLAGYDWELLRAIKGWQIERDDANADVVRLTLPARDGERYSVRFLCDGYPETAPRVAFIDAKGSTVNRAAWPAGNPQFHQVVKLPPASFLCTDLSREGLEHHPGWVNGRTAWKGATHTLINLFNYIHDELLNSPNYQGRAR